MPLLFGKIYKIKQCVIAQRKRIKLNYSICNLEKTLAIKMPVDQKYYLFQKKIIQTLKKEKNC